MNKGGQDDKPAELYPFQKDGVDQLLAGKNIIRAETGVGKTAMMFSWLERSKATKILIVSTPSKIHSGDFEGVELIKFTSKEFRSRLTSLECVSWHMLKKWTNTKSKKDLRDYTVAFDEVSKAKAGVSSQMGRAFLFIAENCKDWAGFSATPGDTWLDYHPYFVATGKVKNKTQFMNDYTISQRYPFPMILGYTNEDTLKRWWHEISYEPDSTSVMSQLPPEVHQVMTFPAPRGYKKVVKTSTTLDGEFLETNMELYHYLRQMCDTKDKQDALSDLLSGLNSPLVVFYNYVCERESIINVAKHLGRKVWRIDGEKHEIPTAETIGDKDVVLCHYLSGSEALNLQFCNYWLSYSYNWSWSTSKQARGRISRIGQKADRMFFYYFVCKDTVEVKVAEALKNKHDFVEEAWRKED